MGAMSDEPVTARTVTGPAILAAMVFLFVHAAASALLTVVAIVVSEGVLAPDWTVAPVWVGGVAVGALSTVPVLRRVSRPQAAGAAAGVVTAVAYTTLWLMAAGTDGVTGLMLRAATLVAGGALGGVLAARRPVTEAA